MGMNSAVVGKSKVLACEFSNNIYTWPLLVCLYFSPYIQ